LGRVSAIDSNGRTIWIADAHWGNGKPFVVRVNEKLAVFLELEFASCACGKQRVIGSSGAISDRSLM